MNQNIKGDDSPNAEMPISLETLEMKTYPGFPPSSVFYDGPGGSYLVDNGKSFFRWSKRGPVITGLTRHQMSQHKGLDHKEAMLAAKSDLADRELDGAVQWCGSIAGHRRGLARDTAGLPILILTEARLSEPKAGPFPTIGDILRQAFPDPEQLAVLIGWLSIRLRAVRAGIHQPGPMLVIAGEVNAGKSLIAWIISQILGGRIANPHAAWTGSMLWNDDLVGAELLLIDDCVGSTDIRSRRALAAAFKEAMYPAQISLRKRNTSSISIRPVWSVMICCNDTPESLQIIPPLDSDLEDKVILLHARKITLGVDTSTPEGRVELQRLVTDELPAFTAKLISHQIPQHLRDSRAGIIAWRDPELTDSLDANSPARRLEDIIESALGNRGVWHDLPCVLTSSEIESRLLDPHGTSREQARGLFTWHGACGSALAKLAATGSRFIEAAEPDTHSKRPRYRVKP